MAFWNRSKEPVRPTPSYGINPNTPCMECDAPGPLRVRNFPYCADCYDKRNPPEVEQVNYECPFCGTETTFPEGTKQPERCDVCKDFVHIQRPVNPNARNPLQAALYGQTLSAQEEKESSYTLFELGQAVHEIFKIPAGPRPAQLSAEGVIVGTSTGTATKGQAVRLPPEARKRHVYIIGKSGSGKSSLLRNLIKQDMEEGRGVIFLDPHGDTAQQLLGYVPKKRTADVVYFCPTEENCPAFNILAAPYPADKLTRDIVSTFKLFFGGDSWGPRLQQILTNALYLLISDRKNEPHSMADLERLLIDDIFRGTITERADDENVKAFWSFQFPRFPKDATAPVLNKLGDFLMPGSPMRRLFSSTANSLDLNQVMNGGKILLCNLSKGELGESAAFFLGGLITTAIAQAALARATIPEAQRRECFFYVDEFQNFAIDSFESILSEARKYNLSMTLAHQYLKQVPSNLLAAVFGNVAVTVCLTISADDAATMQREFGQSVFRHQHTGKVVDPVGDEVRALATAYAKACVYLPKKNATATTPEAADIALDLMPYVIDGVKLSPNVTAGTWPSTQDFIQLDPLQGFLKILKSTNVYGFRISHPATPPDYVLSRSIIAGQRPTAKAPPQPAAPTSSPPTATRDTPTAQPKPKDETIAARAAAFAARTGRQPTFDEILSGVLDEPSPPVKSENRRAEKPQDERNATGEGQPTHQKSTKTDPDDFWT